MNLIKDQWIPARRADGSLCKIAPWEIGACKNPVVDISAPRPDFRGALYQFLIGLVQTAFAPKDDDEWEERWNNIPTCDELKKAFLKFADAFELVNEGGPAFMQDFKLPDKAEEIKILSLLTNSPGINTVNLNKDLFIKRNIIEGMCDACTATAIFALQVNGVAVGAGYRVGIRGGGPLTTIVITDGSGFSIWNIIWSNILTLDERFVESPSVASAEIFPWMGITRESTKDKKTFPEQVSEFQLYWGMPQRIRLSKFVDHGVCDICGIKGLLWIAHRTTNYGVSYSATWQHSLSPYRRKKEDDGRTSLIATKGKEGGLAYPDWLSLTLSNEENEMAAAVVRSFIERKLFKISGMNHYRLWCFGYDAKNAKIRCWYDQIMPLISIDCEKRESFIVNVQKVILGAEDVSKLLQSQVKSAWSSRPKEIKGDTSFILSSFWEETETQFFHSVEKLRVAIETNQPTTTTMNEWRKIIIESAERLFDRFALQETDEIKNMKRVAEASKALTNILNSPKTKSLQVLREEA